MNRDPFLRLALIVSVSAYAVAIAVVWKTFGWPAGIAGLLGPAGAFALALEREEEEPPAPERPDPRRFRVGPPTE